MDKDLIVETQEGLEALIQQWGFLPFFKNPIRGFSVEEIVPPDMLFDEHGDDGAWQWKGPIISHWQCAYGKFFARKAGFVSLDWLPDFINWRRRLFPLRHYCADARRILDVLVANESMLSKELKKASGFTLSRRRVLADPASPGKTVGNRRNGTAFDALVADLQMGAYVCIADFEYLVSRSGERYGWGVARYCTPEAMYGSGILQAVGGRTPLQSRQLLFGQIKNLFPDAPAKAIDKMIGQ